MTLYIFKYNDFKQNDKCWMSRFNFKLFNLKINNLYFYWFRFLKIKFKYWVWILYQMDCFVLYHRWLIYNILSFFQFRSCGGHPVCGTTAVRRPRRHSFARWGRFCWRPSRRRRKTRAVTAIELSARRSCNVS